MAVFCDFNSCVQTSTVNASDQLFEVPTLLTWLPGETLFSLVSRHHYFLGHALASTTCSKYFGHRQSGSQHDLPSRLSHFVGRTKGCFGDVQSIAECRTLLAYYAKFLSTDELQNAIACMAGDSVAHLKLRLGILTSRFRANHPLKACEACMGEDRTAFGWAYWHIDHQLPGVWICQKHGTVLEESSLKASGVERFQWHLPSSKNFLEMASEKKEAIALELAALHSLSQQIIALLADPSGPTIATSRLHEVYRAELMKRGWVTAGGNFRMPEIAASYLEHVKRLRVLPELEALPATRDEAAIQLGRLLRPPRSGTHPLRHLVLINWLFQSTESFQNAYATVCRPSEDTFGEGAVSNIEPTPDAKDARHDDLVRILTLENLSLRKAALVLGIDVSTAMSWAARAGFSVARRPKKLSGAIRQQTIVDLQNGVDKVVAAQNAGVSVVTITKLLLSEVGLHAHWTQSREARARESARVAWTQLLQTHGHIGVKLMRAMEPAAYAWLYRNDRPWLEEHKPDRIEVPSTTGVSRVPWDTRDMTLSVEVERVVLKLRQNGAIGRIKLWQIYQALPALKAKLAALDRLPLTRRAIELALQHRAGGGPEPELF